MEQDCVFCKIISGQLPSYKIYEDEYVLAFLDLQQFVPGHTLVVPKEHFQYVWDITDAGKFYAAAQKIAKHFRKLGYKYVDSITFGRMIAHAHLHLIPHNGDDLNWEKATEQMGKLQGDVSRRKSKTEMQDIAQSLSIN